MSVPKIFDRALDAAFRTPQLGLAVYLLNLLLALPLVYAIRGFLAGTGAAESFGPLSSNLDTMLLMDFLTRHGEAVGALAGTLLPLALLALVLNAILTGGILFVFSFDEPFSLRRLLEGCGLFAFRFVRVLLWIALCLVGGAFLIGLSFAFGDSVIFPRTSETAGYLAGAAGAAVVVSGLILVIVAGDFARALTVVEGGRSMLRALWKSFRFLFRNAGGAIGLLCLFLVANGGLFLLYFFLEGRSGTGSSLRLAFVIILQQVIMMLRSMLRVALCGAELEFYGTRSGTRLPQAGAEAAGVPG